jgi:hypothetical protein
LLTADGKFLLDATLDQTGLAPPMVIEILARLQMSVTTRTNNRSFG